MKLPKSKNTSSLQGFTLVELLIVVMIISILTGLILGVLNPAGIRQKSRDNQRKADLKKVQIALESYYADNRGYPRSDGWILVASGVSNVATAAISSFVNPVPSDPSSWTGTNPCVTSGAGYLYRAPSTGTLTLGTSYDLTATMEVASSVGANLCPTSICASAVANCYGTAGPNGFSP